MACISPDGKPTESGTKMLRALQSGLGTPEKISEGVELPLYRVRSSIRELILAGLAIEKDGSYELTEEGAKLIS